MEFSFVITYRDRDVQAVQRCLSSLLNQQTSSEYEICFVDYGSQESFRQPLATFIAAHPRIKYRYAATRGWLWCRSHANNMGIDMASGRYIVMVDVDLMYPSFFLEKVKKYIDPQTQVLYHCYFAPQEFEGYENLDFGKKQPFRHTSNTLTETGLMAAPKQAFVEAGYYDEYFKVWGIEDAEMNQRIQAVGYKPVKMPLEEVYGVHQWHVSNTLIDLMPKNWYEFMKKRTQQATDIKQRYYLPKNDLEGYGLLRQFAQNQEASVAHERNQTFVFTAPFALSCIRFIYQFEALQEGEVLIVEQPFELISAKAVSKLSQVMGFLNRKALQYKLSYRIIEAVPFETEVIDFLRVRDFVYFFLVEQEAKIADYYLEVRPKEHIKLFLTRRQ
jgi:predicted glycosyltransferase involved in capsule biosynthesis